MTTRVPGIPVPTPDNLVQVASAVKEVIEVREGVRGDPLDKAVTFRDLEALKLVQEKETAPVAANVATYLPVQPLPGVAPGAFKPDNYDESSDLNTPPAPFDLRADGAYSIINLSWQYPVYRNHAYAEIYRSTADNLTTAVLIGTTSGTLYSDPVGTEKKYYYWVRNVSQANIKSPYNSTYGAYGETAVDVAERIAAIEEEINNETLTKELGDRITLLEDSGTSFITELRRIEAGQVSLTSQVVAQDAYSRTAIQVQQSAVAGLSAQYSVKIDNNGYVSGFGLSSTVVNGTPTSAFIIRADKFAIVDPAGSGNSLTNTPSASSVPFSVVNGQTYIKSAFIQDASITNAKIQSISTDKITAGTVTAAIDLVSPIVRSGYIIPGQAGFFLGQWSGVNQFYVGNGSTGTNGRSLQFDGSNTIVRGDIYAYGGTIGGANITGSYIQSTNYFAGSSGWRLDANGNLEANNGNFRGNITGASGTFSGSLSATSGTIGGNTITSGGIYSPNFVNGSSGWGIDSAGQAQFNNVTIRGSLRAGSHYTGAVLRDSISDQQIPFTGGGNHFVALYTGTSPSTSSSIRFYGSSYHSSVPFYQRLRGDQNQQIGFIILASGTVDHFFTIWYRINGGSWIPLASMEEPQTSYGTATLGFATAQTIGSGTYIDFGASPTNSSGSPLNGSAISIYYLTMSVITFNL